MKPTTSILLRDLVPELQSRLLATLSGSEWDQAAVVRVMREQFGVLGSHIEARIIGHGDQAVLVTVLTVPEGRNAELAASEFQRASELANGGRLKEAITIFKALVADWPEVGIYRRNLAQAYLMAGAAEDAEDELLRALALDPNDPALVMILANTRMQQGRVLDALPLYEKSLELGRNVYALYNLGVAHLRLGNRIEALKPVSRGVSRGSDL